MKYRSYVAQIRAATHVVCIDPARRVRVEMEEAAYIIEEAAARVGYGAAVLSGHHYFLKGN